MLFLNPQPWFQDLSGGVLFVHEKHAEQLDSELCVSNQRYESAALYRPIEI